MFNGEWERRWCRNWTKLVQALSLEALRSEPFGFSRAGLWKEFELVYRACMCSASEPELLADLSCSVALAECCATRCRRLRTDLERLEGCGQQVAFDWKRLRLQLLTRWVQLQSSVLTWSRVNVGHISDGVVELEVCILQGSLRRGTGERLVCMT